MRTTIANTKSPHPNPLPAYRERGLSLAVGLCIALIVGCTSSKPLAVDKDLSGAATQPSNAAVSAADFEKLWTASDLAARDLLFMPARQDRRAGLYITEPNTSGQWFEPWRRDAITVADRTQSSLASIRRTLTVKIEKADDGTFVAKPSVLVERYALAERRITTSASYRSVFRERNTNFGTIETDNGLILPQSYWYDIGHDPTLENYVAGAITRQLKKLG